MNNVLERIGKIGLVPVAVIEDADLAVPAAKALIDGGLNIIEITMRTEQGIAAIKNVKREFPEMLVGAGTVLSIEKAAESVEAGAEFVVSPGFNHKLVEWCIDKGVAITPGCVTPTEIEQALQYGLSILKFFPASIYGGINGCKALSGPYRMVKFIPTGGVDIKNLSDYADKPYIYAIGGGWLCNSADIKSNNFGAITMTIKESVNVLLGFELAHIGINASNDTESLNIADALALAFGFNVKKCNSSNFAGSGIEVNKSFGIGEKGHIAIRTNSIERAVYYLGMRGYKVDWSTRKGSEERPAAVYLKDSFGGFSIHLLQK